ncbi:lysis system i-spanin subunit Rz [Pseudomonas gingeri]|uniref:lysis system i-spanin subunit Rz n=1 Tax=Pseudomonas gingeri TaxID=117681 RepID=UPI00159FD616|nr:lysis system i-spanin subunit Rz [Pseudomonas gingeri]NWA04821.1 lysis protein [Pseudomonas gingeri]NWA17702.1 lysis protein [Pseudomonas gingeri]NWA56890.1 lysis protein [Pseudomonas gingeri]NWA97244.1 lysis protein [Pseudomonas gingeri]NWB01704.1 lysis protein [Pseudomonas gingeri]
MRLLELIPVPYRLATVVVSLALVAAGSAAASWQVQNWRYGQQLEQQARLQADALNEQSRASAALQRAEQDKRLALEQRLQASDQIHSKELNDVQQNQARLRDRLATSDLRLSVLLDRSDPAVGCAVPTTPAAGSVVNAAPRARLDPAHAQRIVAITDDGDRALIALAACQAYINEVLH